MISSVTLEEVSDFVLDGTHGSPERSNDGVPVLSAQHVKGGKLSYETNRFTSVAEYEYFAQRVTLEEGDLLLTIVGTIGRAAIVEIVRPAVFQRSVAIIRPKKDVLCSRYLFHVTQSSHVREQLERATNKSAQAGVYLGKLKKIAFPLPSFAEQRRIAAILDQADALRAKRRQTLTQLDEMARAIFVDMFGEPQTWSSRWLCRSFDETMSDETSRSIKLQTHEFHTDGLFPIIDQGQTAIAGYSDNPAYLCVSRLPCIVFGDHTRIVKLIRHPFIIGADGAKVLVPRDGVEATFLAYAMRFAQIPDLGYSRHMREVKRLSFPAPPMELQMTFARIVDFLENQRHALASSASEFEGLFTSLQHRAFRGEL